MEALAVIIFILATIFNAYSESKKKKKKYEERQKRKTIPMDTIETKDNLPKESVFVEEANVKKAFVDVVKKVKGKKDTRPASKERKIQETSKPLLEFSNEEVVKGIIMAEILSPPKALKAQKKYHINS